MKKFLYCTLFIVISFFSSSSLYAASGDLEIIETENFFMVGDHYEGLKVPDYDKIPISNQDEIKNFLSNETQDIPYAFTNNARYFYYELSLSGSVDIKTIIDDNGDELPFTSDIINGRTTIQLPANFFSFNTVGLKYFQEAKDITITSINGNTLVFAFRLHTPYISFDSQALIDDTSLSYGSGKTIIYTGSSYNGVGIVDISETTGTGIFNVYYTPGSGYDSMTLPGISIIAKNGYDINYISAPVLTPNKCSFSSLFTLPYKKESSLGFFPFHPYMDVKNLDSGEMSSYSTKKISTLNDYFTVEDNGLYSFLKLTSLSRKIPFLCYQYFDTTLPQGVELSREYYYVSNSSKGIGYNSNEKYTFPFEGIGVYDIRNRLNIIKEFTGEVRNGSGELVFSADKNCFEDTACFSTFRDYVNKSNFGIQISYKDEILDRTLRAINTPHTLSISGFNGDFLYFSMPPMGPKDDLVMETTTGAIISFENLTSENLSERAVNISDNQEREVPDGCRYATADDGLPEELLNSPINGPLILCGGIALPPVNCRYATVYDGYTQDEIDRPKDPMFPPIACHRDIQGDGQSFTIGDLNLPGTLVEQRFDLSNEEKIMSENFLPSYVNPDTLSEDTIYKGPNGVVFISKKKALELSEINFSVLAEINFGVSRLVFSKISFPNIFDQVEERGIGPTFIQHFSLGGSDLGENKYVFVKKLIPILNTPISSLGGSSLDDSDGVIFELDDRGQFPNLVSPVNFTWVKNIKFQLGQSSGVTQIDTSKIFICSREVVDPENSFYCMNYDEFNTYSPVTRNVQEYTIYGLPGVVNEDFDYFDINFDFSSDTHFGNGSLAL